MATQRISHIEHRVPGTGVWRPGETSHEESGTDLEGYLRPLEQVHASALHGSGVAEGLTVLAAPGSATVRVAPGVAIDSVGRHIVLTPGGQVEVSDDPDHSSRLVTLSEDGVDLSTAGQSGACRLTVQWRETFDKQLLEDTFQQTFLNVHTPWLRVLPVDTPTPDIRVVLATLTLDANGVVAPDGVSADGRQGLAPGVGALRIRATSRAPSPAGLRVTEATAGQLRARPGGGLQLQVAGPAGAGQVELLAENGNIAQVSLSTDRLALRRADKTEPIVLDTAGGKIGVGTASPRSPLGIRGSGATEELLSFENRAGQTKWHVNQNPGTGPGLNIGETGVAEGRLFVRAGGNVGVNTTAPSHPLHVADNKGIRQNELYLGGGAGWSSLTYNAHHNETNNNWVFPNPARPAVTVELDDAGGVPRFQVWSTTPANTTGFALRFNVNGQTGAVDVPGSLNVGTGGLTVGANPIHVTSAWSGFPDAATNQAEISNDTGTYKTLMIVGNKSAGGVRKVSIWDRLEVNGQSCAQSFCNLSDGRLKIDVAVLDAPLDRVAQLRGVSFRWQPDMAAAGAAGGIGVIAQNVAEVFPELVSTIGPQQHLAVDYSGLTAVLLEAVKELKAENEWLRRRVDALEERGSAEAVHSQVRGGGASDVR